MAVTYVDRPPAGWFVLDVMQREHGSQEWAALMIDVDPDDFGNYNHRAPARGCWVAIPGKHGDRDAAYDALEEMMATRH